MSEKKKQNTSKDLSLAIKDRTDKEVLIREGRIQMGIKAIIDKNMAKDKKILTTKEEIVTIDSKEMKEDHKETNEDHKETKEDHKEINVDLRETKEDHKETNEDHSRINTDKTDQLSQGKADRKLFTTKENSIRNSSKNNR